MDTNNGKYLGVAVFIIILGCLLLLNNFFPWLMFAKTWPIMLIIIGIYLIVRPTQKEDK